MTAADRKISAADIMPMPEYTKIRREHRRKLVEIKRQRRLHVGPFVTLHFENYETMWAQVQEMLYIEKGGDEQLAGELEAYNPLIPQGRELVATMLLEIEDEIVRKRTLARLGHIEEKVYFSFAGHQIYGVPEDDTERTTEEGKTSSVHFLHFPFTAEQADAFRKAGTQIILGISHENYGHMSVLQEDARAALAQDFA